MKLYDRLLGIQTPQALVIAHILDSFSLIIQLMKHLFDIFSIRWIVKILKNKKLKF